MTRESTVAIVANGRIPPLVTGILTRSCLRYTPENQKCTLKNDGLEGRKTPNLQLWGFWVYYCVDEFFPLAMKQLELIDSSHIIRKHPENPTHKTPRWKPAFSSSTCECNYRNYPTGVESNLWNYRPFDWWFLWKNHEGTNRKQIVKAEELYNKKRQKFSPKNLH